MGEENRNTTCHGCRLVLPRKDCYLPDRFNASGEYWNVFSDLTCYTIAEQDREFIHQHAVDACEAQHAGGATRNITVAFGLFGLYLALEKDILGEQVQQAQSPRTARSCQL